MSPNYAVSKAVADRLDAEAKAAGDALQVFPRGPMGLVDDAAKASPGYQAANLAYARAFKASRAFNAVFVKMFRAERAADRAARVPKSS